jgi:hypothetical protein
VLTRILREVGALMVQTRPLVERRGSSSNRVMQRARSRLMAMHEVVKPLRGQLVHGVAPGKVAANKIVPVGMPPARAIGRTKAGKKTELGLASLVNRWGGGSLFGPLIAANADERQMPLQALAESRTLCGQTAPPELVGYDRGGDAPATRQQLTVEGGQHGGIPPQGQRPWSVAEGVREQMRRERGRTEGSIGTLQSNRYKVNKPKDRLWPTLERAGSRSLWSFNLNTFMWDVVALVS